MTVARFAISFDQNLARAVRRAAGKQATSAWLADAARRKLRSEGLLQVVRDWEDEHGQLREVELPPPKRKPRARKRT